MCLDFKQLLCSILSRFLRKTGTGGTRLLFTVFDFALLLLGEELPHLLVPLQCPLIDHHKLPWMGLQPAVDAASQALTLACRDTFRLHAWIHRMAGGLTGVKLQTTCPNHTAGPNRVVLTQALPSVDQQFPRWSFVEEEWIGQGRAVFVECLSSGKARRG